MLALSLGRSRQVADKATAISLYESLIRTASPEAMDEGNLAILLTEAGRFDEAKSAVLDGIERFPAKTAYFSEIGLKVVSETGDKDFRKQLNAAVEARGKND
jgi:hypothetical protein